MFDLEKQTFTYEPEPDNFYDSLPKPIRFTLCVMLSVYFGGAMLVPLILVLRSS